MHIVFRSICETDVKGTLYIRQRTAYYRYVCPYICWSYNSPRPLPGHSSAAPVDCNVAPTICMRCVRCTNSPFLLVVAPPLSTHRPHTTPHNLGQFLGGPIPNRFRSHACFTVQAPVKYWARELAIIITCSINHTHFHSLFFVPTHPPP